jgi:hypothetical protein
MPDYILKSCEVGLSETGPRLLPPFGDTHVHEIYWPQMSMHFGVWTIAAIIVGLSLWFSFHRKRKANQIRLIFAATIVALFLLGALIYFIP